MSAYQASSQHAWERNQLRTVLFELTYTCNWDCTFCYNDRSLGGTPLSLERFEQALGDLAAMKVLNVILSGGEPLAHPDFFSIGSRARQLGFVVRIKSNAHAINETTARRIQTEIDPLIIETSLHGASPTTHDLQTQVKGSFERWLRNVQTMLHVGLRVKVNSVLTHHNENELEAMFELTDRLGVRFQIDREVKPRDDGDTSPLTQSASQQAHQRLDQIYAERAKHIPRLQHAPAQTPPPRTKHCGTGSSTLTVDPYGQVFPCVQWRKPIANLHEQLFSEIWQKSDKLNEIREFSQMAHQKLKNLPVNERPKTFCLGLAEQLTGNPLSLYTLNAPRNNGGKRRLALIH